MNQINLIGRLTKDPEFAITTTGVSVCKFTLAVPRAFAKDEVDFIETLAWKKTAEVCRDYLHKGDRCAVSGRLQIDQYEAKDGSKRSRSQVIVNELEFLQNKSEKTDNQPDKDLVPIDDDSLPF